MKEHKTIQVRETGKPFQPPRLIPAREGRQIRPPLPDFLDRSKMLPDIDTKDFMPYSAAILRISQKHQKNRLRNFRENGDLVTSCFAVLC